MRIRIGTRGSKLALIQTELVRQRLLEVNPELLIEIVSIKTSGDQIKDQSLAEIGGKALFVKEIEEALFANEIDIAVHSFKDIPAFLPDGLVVGCVLEREDPRDAFLSTSCNSLTDLPIGATLGTSSPRRAAQALYLRPDLQIVNFRGNVDTRLQKLESGIVDATILAVAGLRRCQTSTNLYSIMNDKDMLPAVAQGAIAIECKKDYAKILELLSYINHMPSYLATKAERGFLEGMNASCKTPVAAYAELTDLQLYLRCLIALPDGSEIYRAEKFGNIEDGYKLGKEAAEELKRYDSFAHA